ncbi:hypothetical protein [Micromonospora sp. NPDC049891]|uniref:hypothetical protein n=1 Tax=Micromonospora sp. NPDC049891 TaxID=3155655 RepID=UPI0033C8142C
MTGRPTVAEVVSRGRTLLNALLYQGNQTPDVMEAARQLGQVIDRYDTARPPLVCCRYWRTSGGQTHNVDCAQRGDGRWPLTVPYEQAAQLVNQQRNRTLNPKGQP